MCEFAVQNIDGEFFCPSLAGKSDKPLYSSKEEVVCPPDLTSCAAFNSAWSNNKLNNLNLQRGKRRPSSPQKSGIIIHGPRDEGVK